MNPLKLVVNPRELTAHTRQVIAEVCGCEGCYETEHPGTLTAEEIAELRIRMNGLLMRLEPAGPAVPA